MPDTNPFSMRAIYEQRTYSDRRHMPAQVLDMKIIALERELAGATSEAYQRFARDEAHKAWDLHQSGLIRELYFRVDESSAVLVLECESTDDAAKILAELPFVREGLISFELIPLRAYPGFARLFK